MHLFEILAGVSKYKLAPLSATLWAWGANGNGQHGDNTITSKSSPTQVASGTSWKSIYTNGTRTYAIKPDNTLWAWGSNVFGLLGDGTVVNRSSPVQIAGSWTQVVGTGLGTWGIKTDGSMWTWGYNLNDTMLGTYAASAPPSWSMLDTNGNTVLGIKANTLFMWGYGGSNEFPTNDYSTSNQPSPKDVFALNGANNITGFANGLITAVYKAQFVPGPAVLALARISPDGVAAGNTYLIGWGYNSGSALRSTTAGQYVAPKATAQWDQPITDFWATKGTIGAQYVYDLGVYMQTANGNGVWGYGHNYHLLGNGATAYNGARQSSPVVVLSRTSYPAIVDMAIGKNQTLALANTGALYAWGDAGFSGFSNYNVSYSIVGAQANLAIAANSFFEAPNHVTWNPADPSSSLTVMWYSSDQFTSPPAAYGSFASLVTAGRTDFTLYNVNAVYYTTTTIPGSKKAANVMFMNYYGAYNEGFNEYNNTTVPYYIRGGFAGSSPSDNIGEAFNAFINKLTSNTASGTPRTIYIQQRNDSGSMGDYVRMYENYAVTNAPAGGGDPRAIYAYASNAMDIWFSNNQPSTGMLYRTLKIDFNFSMGYSGPGYPNVVQPYFGDATVTLQFSSSSQAQDFAAAFNSSYVTGGGSTVSGGFLPYSFFLQFSYQGIYRLNDITSMTWGGSGSTYVTIVATSATQLSSGYTGQDKIYIADGFSVYTAPTTQSNPNNLGRVSYDITISGQPTSVFTQYQGQYYATYMTYGAGTFTSAPGSRTYTSNNYLLFAPPETPVGVGGNMLNDYYPKLVKYGRWANGTTFKTNSGFLSIGAANQVSIMLLRKDSANLVLTMGNTTSGALMRTYSGFDANTFAIPTVVSYTNGIYSNTGANWVWVKASRDTTFVQNGDEYAAGTNTAFPANAIFYGGNNAYMQAGNTTVSVASPTMLLSAWQGNSTFWYRSTPNTFASSNAHTIMALNDGTWTAANSQLSNGIAISSYWNSFGQFGIGTTDGFTVYSMRPLPGSVIQYFSSPVQVGTPKKLDGTNATNSWTLLTSPGGVGSHGVLGLHADGTLYSIGMNITDGSMQSFNNTWSSVYGGNPLGTGSYPMQMQASSYTQVSAEVGYSNDRYIFSLIKGDKSGWMYPSGTSYLKWTNGGAWQNAVAGSLPTPIFNSDVKSWKQIAASQWTNYGIAANGSLWAWGVNPKGMTSNANPMGANLTVNFANNWTSVSIDAAGREVATALGSDGTLYVWGKSSSSGGAVLQLVDSRVSNTVPAVTADDPPRYYAKPTWTDTSWTQVMNNAYAVAAIKTDGTLWTWGSGHWGELGDGTVNKYALSPVQLAGSWSVLPTDPAKKFTFLAAKTDGTLWAWGFRPSYITGSTETDTGNGYYSSSPVQVQSSITGTPITQIESMYGTAGFTDGAHMPVFICKNDNTLWAWGGNSNKLISAEEGVIISSPVQVTSSSWSLVRVSPAGDMVAGIKTDGTLWGWGTTVKPYNGGSGTQTPTSNYLWPTGHTGTQSRLSWSMITYNGYVYAGITSTGALYTWGKTTTLSGAEFGLTGTAADMRAPRKVGNDSWTTVSVGFDFMVGIKSNGTLWSWGSNLYGQLGQNLPTTTKVYSPAQVGTSSWTAVAAGYAQAYAIRSDGTLWGWGENNLLGDGAGVARSSPVQLMAGNTVTKIALSRSSNQKAAINSLGALYVWGSNSYGELGLNSITSTATPTKVGTSSWTAVGCGAQFTMLIRSDGTLWTAGRNNAGQLGDSTIINKSAPVQVGTLTGWTSVNPVSYNPAINWTAYASRGTTLFGWGQAGFGEGLLTPVPRSSPVQLSAASGTAGGLGISIATANGEVRIFSNAHANSMFMGTANASHGNFQVLGDQPTIYITSPVQLAAGSWTQVGFGTESTIRAIRDDGSLWSWGTNENGEIGNGTAAPLSSPVQIGTSSWAFIGAKGTNLIRDTAGRYFHLGNECLAILQPNTSGYDKVYDVHRSRVTSVGQYASSPVQVGNLNCSFFTEPVRIGTSKWLKIATGTYNHQSSINVATSNVGTFIPDVMFAGIRDDYCLFIWGTSSANGAATGMYDNNSNTIIVSTPIQIGSNDDIYIDASVLNGVVLTLKK